MTEREGRVARPTGRVFVPRADVMDGDDVRRALVRIAHEILERNHGTDEIVLVGLQTGGVPLAGRLVAEIAEIDGSTVPLGTLDVALYRDDASIRPAPSQEATEIPVDLTGRVVVLVDDVLFTGRTVRAAARRAGGPRAGAGRATGGDGRPGSPGAADPAGLRGQEPADVPERDGRGERRRGRDRRPQGGVGVACRHDPRRGRLARRGGVCATFGPSGPFAGRDRGTCPSELGRRGV